MTIVQYIPITLDTLLIYIRNQLLIYFRLKLPVLKTDLNIFTRVDPERTIPSVLGLC